MRRAEQRGLVLSGEQTDTLAHVTDGRGLGIVVDYTGTGNSVMLDLAREALEDTGYEVRGVALPAWRRKISKADGASRPAPSPA